MTRRGVGGETVLFVRPLVRGFGRLVGVLEKETGLLVGSSRRRSPVRGLGRFIGIQVRESTSLLSHPVGGLLDEGSVGSSVSWSDQLDGVHLGRNLVCSVTLYMGSNYFVGSPGLGPFCQGVSGWVEYEGTGTGYFFGSPGLRRFGPGFDQLGDVRTHLRSGLSIKPFEWGSFRCGGDGLRVSHPVVP